MIPIVVWYSKLIQNVLGGRYPDFGLSPKKNSHTCAQNVSVSINVVR